MNICSPVALPQLALLPLLRAIALGHYESAERELARKHLIDGLPTVELGGAYGVVARLIQDTIGPDTQFVCVEANPAVLDLLRRNAMMDSGNAELVHAAISCSGDKTVPFQTSELVLDGHTTDKPGDGTIDVPVKTLSEVLSGAEIDGDYALVCDIEGSEYELFVSDLQALSRCRIAIVEFHPAQFAEAGRHMSDFFDLVNKAGFEIVDRIENVIVCQRAAE